MSDPLEILAGAAAPDAPPPTLLPYQQRWVVDGAPLKVAEKSRRIGLTWAEAADDALDAARAGGSSTFYICPNRDMGREFIEAVAMWARAYGLAASEIGEGVWDDGADVDPARRYIKTFEVEFPATGRRVTALTSRPSNLRGKQGNIVIDEAAFHPDLKALLKAALAMLLWGNKVRVVSTHDGVDNEFNELIQEIRAGKRGAGAAVHRISFREAVAEGLYRRVCLRRGIEWTQAGEDAWVAEAYKFYGDDAAEELDAIPSQSGGAYLTMALIEARMSPDTPVVRGKWTADFGHQSDQYREAEARAWCEEHLGPVLLRLDPKRQFALGEDFGRLGDLTVLSLIEEGADLVSRCRLQVELSNCPFRQQEQILTFVGDRVPRLRSLALDATGNGQYLAERAAQKYGAARVQQVKLNDAFYLENMPRFKAALQDATLDCLPRDAQTRDDLRALRVIDGVPKLPKAKTQEADGPKLQRHGDSAIAHFLAHFAMKREVAPIEWTPAPPRASRWEGDGGLADYEEPGHGLGGSW